MTDARVRSGDVELSNFVGGRFHQNPTRDRTIALVDPASGDQVGTVPDTSAEDVDAACATAALAFEQWRRTTPAERQRALLQIADLLEGDLETLTALEVADTGKPARAVREYEIPATVDHLRFFAGAARLLEGRSTGEYLEGVTSGTRREPIGVCGQITPWNYPFMMAMWKWAPAVAAGNTVVLKPSELTPRTALRSAELAGRVLPPGVFNVVCGAVATGEALVANSNVAMVCLTGSPRAGRAVATVAAGRLARVHLELGGNAPVVVFEDGDLQAAASAVAYAGFYNAGQDCTAATRVLVAERVHDVFTALLVAEAEATRTGEPDDDTMTFGPLASAAQLQRVQGFLARVGPHAKVLTGGQALNRPGFFFPATVVDGVRQQDEITREEIFGPVVTVQSFSSETEAVALANGVDHGLTATVFTADHARAMRLTRDLDFGAVSVNVHGPSTPEMPHGGFGASGYGKDLGVYGLEEYTRVKHVAHAW